MTDRACLIALRVAIVPPMNPSVEERARIERRSQGDRRRRIWWALLYGGFRPRRRAPSRRLGEARYQSLDWHDSHLLAVALGIVILSVVDAFLTLALMQAGAVEVNPLMALVLYRDVATFAAVKMALTGSSVLSMVALARYRLLRVFRVDVLMYAALAGYCALIGYEWRLLDGLGAAVFW